MKIQHLSDKRPASSLPAPLFTDKEEPTRSTVIPARSNLPFSASAQPTAFGKTDLHSNVEEIREKLGLN